jgi:hypothetical protein
VVARMNGACTRLDERGNAVRLTFQSAPVAS